MSEVAVQWAEHVRRWRSGGLTRAAYCAEHGVKAATLSYWAWRLGKTQRAVAAPAPMVPAFVPVQVVPAAKPPMLVEVSYAGGLRLGLPVGIDVVWVAALVRALAC
ncbi:MAG TPA: IS66 family insertion sequence element accessory protein TnpB [Rhodanobacter sp.]|nr:IS66 family insertion sequence element accessory protein TnpB [Rhodanobacter sp.]